MNFTIGVSTIIVLFKSGQNVYVSPKWLYLGIRPLREVINVQWGDKGEPLNQSRLVPLEEEWKTPEFTWSCERTVRKWISAV